LDTNVANKTGDVVYLHLTPGKPFTNIGSKIYVIKAFYRDKELYSDSFYVKGKADIKIKDVLFNASHSSLDLEELTLEVRNEGNAPLYLIPRNIELYLDGSRRSFSLSPLTVMPMNISSLSLKPLISIDPNYLDEEHRVDVVILNVTRASYTIEPLKPELRIEKVGLKPFLDKWSVDNITLIISNRGKYPINIRWLKIYVNEELNALWTPSIEVIGPREEKEVILSLAAITSRPFTLKVKLGATEVSYSG
jgi:hypothetical protein